MYKLNFLKTVEKENCKINIYSNDYYEVEEKNYKNFKSITISRKNDEGAVIYVIDTIGTRELLGFEIQTKSWGSLPIEELQEKIKEYQIAIETVKELNKIFLK